jgi:hypothetical protein
LKNNKEAKSFRGNLMIILKQIDMTKNELITKIRTAFKDIKLEDGIGLWEGQGIDDYADEEEILKLRSKDERNNWDNISYEDIAYASSSLSFFDAKGMRFCLPKFLIFNLLSDEIFKEKGFSSPDVIFTLGYNLNDEYQKARFSLFTKQQIETIIHFLEYKLEKIVSTDNEYYYVELNRTLNEWKLKLKLNTST